MVNSIKQKSPGILLCLLIAIPSWFLGKLIPVIGGPVFAILLGMCLALLIHQKQRKTLNPGIAFTSKKILQLAVILLGFGMNLSEIASVGLTSIPIILSTISISLITAFVLFKLLKLPSNLSVLIGVGSSICGGSAIAATAPVIGADDEDVAQSISVIFLFNVIAALLFPTLGGLLGLSDYGFGLFAGTAVNDTSSVTAAATAWDAIHHANTLDTAAVVKMTRTLAILPITLVLAFVRTKKSASGSTQSKANLKKIFPYFILFFLLASVITTLGTMLHVPSEIFTSLKTVSKFLIVTAMSAIGLNTNLVKLIKSGAKPILTGFCCWVAIALVSLGMQHILGIW